MLPATYRSHPRPSLAGSMASWPIQPSTKRISTTLLWAIHAARWALTSAPVSAHRVAMWASNPRRFVNSGGRPTLQSFISLRYAGHFPASLAGAYESARGRVNYTDALPVLLTGAVNDIPDGQVLLRVLEQCVERGTLRAKTWRCVIFCLFFFFFFKLYF